MNDRTAGASTRRQWMAGAAALSVYATLAHRPVAAAQGARRARLTLSGPFALVSYPLMRIADSGALSDMADQVEFTTWKSPDQLRAIAIGQTADFIAAPSNVAANLYNRGVPLKLLDISTWGLLWMVSREQGLRTLADFRGKEVVMPFRGDMPDIVFSLLAEREGIDARNDVRLRYVASPIDAMQLLLLRRVDHALLAEPAVSMALRKSGSFPVSLVAPDLYRAVDLQQEWKRAFGGDARIPQAGIAVLGALRDRPDAVARIATAYDRGLAWCDAHAQQCGEIVSKHVPMLSAEAIADAIDHGHMQAVSAADARPALEALFRKLLEKSPGLVGGKLPPDDFYASPALSHAPSSASQAKE